jgi:predicted enzyme related to lactoylglutathione lyase
LRITSLAYYPDLSFPGGRCFHFLDPSGNELAAMQAVVAAN